MVTLVEASLLSSQCGPCGPYISRLRHITALPKCHDSLQRRLIKSNMKLDVGKYVNRNKNLSYEVQLNTTDFELMSHLILTSTQ